MQGDYYLSLRLKKERVLELGSEEEFLKKNTSQNVIHKPVSCEDSGFMG